MIQMDYIIYSITFWLDMIKYDKKKGTLSKVAIEILISCAELNCNLTNLGKCLSWSSHRKYHRGDAPS